LLLENSLNVNSKNVVEIKVVEQWLNDTLSEAELLRIPGCYFKDGQRLPIAKYGIDRMTLTNAGIPNNEVSHLYRALFVYSIGFYNLIKEILNKSKSLKIS
jgi:hypothetical protein